MPQSIGIAGKAFRKISLDPQDQRDALARGGFLEGIDGSTGQLARIEGDLFEHDAAGGKLGEVEDVVDDCHQQSAADSITAVRSRCPSEIQ